MSKKIIFAILILIIAAIAVGFLFGAYLLPKIKPEGRPYHGVFLETGDFYVGRLSKYPFWKMTDVHLIQRDQTTGELSLLPLKETSIWSPDSIRINPKKIIIWGKIGQNSQVMEALTALKEQARNPQPRNQAPVRPE